MFRADVLSKSRVTTAESPRWDRLELSSLRKLDYRSKSTKAIPQPRRPAVRSYLFIHPLVRYPITVLVSARKLVTYFSAFPQRVASAEEIFWPCSVCGSKRRVLHNSQYEIIAYHLSGTVIIRTYPASRPACFKVSQRRPS